MSRPSVFFEQAEALMLSRPMPSDIVERLETLEKQMTDETEKRRMGDIWEALIAAGIIKN